MNKAKIKHKIELLSRMTVARGATLCEEQTAKELIEKLNNQLKAENSDADIFEKFWLNNKSYKLKTILTEDSIDDIIDELLRQNEALQQAMKTC